MATFDTQKPDLNGASSLPHTPPSKENAVTKLRTSTRSSKVAILVSAWAIFSLCHVVTAAGFTLVELQLLPAIQLVAQQSLLVKVSNVSTESVDLTVDIVSGNGTLLVTKTATLAAGQTLSLPFLNNSTGNKTVRAVVMLGTASATVSSMMTLSNTNGQVIAIVPGVKLQ
jgi:hypothetical protein